MMSNFVITFSPTGGTKRVAKILADSFGCDSFIDLTKRNGDFASYSFTADDINCMSCVFVCSYSARVVNEDTYNMLAAKLTKLCADRKQVKLYL